MFWGRVAVLFALWSMPVSATVKAPGYLDELLDWTQTRSFPISIVTDTTSGDRSVHTNRTIAIGETILDIPLQFMITQYAFQSYSMLYASQSYRVVISSSGHTVASSVTHGRHSPPAMNHIYIPLRVSEKSFF